MKRIKPNPRSHFYVRQLGEGQWGVFSEHGPSILALHDQFDLAIEDAARLAAGKKSHWDVRDGRRDLFYCFVLLVFFGIVFYVMTLL